MIWKYVFGVVAIFLGTYQMIISYKYLRTTQKHGGKSTSYFVGYAIWDGFVIGLIIFLVGIYLIVVKGAFE
ncbi:hypothetical protein CPR19088_GLDEOEPO_00003 [Companilactobacillus paralimentarius]